MDRSSTLRAGFLFLFLLAGGVVGCATPLPDVPTPRQQLYFAIELTEDGKKVGNPQLLGFEGRQVIAEKQTPGKSEPDYRLVLKPTESKQGYKVVLEVVLPSGKKLGEVVLLHGEERSVQLGEATQLKLLLMKVDSPEFRALMKLKPEKGRGTI